MADYLTGLAARALGVATVVRPRPAARFESRPPEEQEAASAASPPGPPGSPAPARPAKTPSARVEPAERPAPTAVRAARAATAQPAQVDLELEPALRDDAILPAARGAPPRRAARRGAAPGPTTAAPGRTDENAAPVVRPAARRAAERPALRPEGASREPPPVRVTIGRIEVRAVASPPPPPRPAPQRPEPLSLDEYLEVRRNGRR
jgi:hypothetical protein